MQATTVDRSYISENQQASEKTRRKRLNEKSKLLWHPFIEPYEAPCHICTKLMQQIEEDPLVSAPCEVTRRGIKDLQINRQNSRHPNTAHWNPSKMPAAGEALQHPCEAFSDSLTRRVHKTQQLRWGCGYPEGPMTLKSRGPIPIYYESLYGIWTLNPFRVHFVLKDEVLGLSNSQLEKEHS